MNWVNAIFFEDNVADKIQELDVASKRAIYFETIDALFIIQPGRGNQIRSFIYSGDNPVLQDRGTALYIERVATQKEFSDYIDYGGVLTSSPLRNPAQTDVADYEIKPGKPAVGELTDIVLHDGTRHSGTEATLLAAVNGDRSKIKQHIYTMRQAGQLGIGLDDLRCAITGDTTRVTPSIKFTSFQTRTSAQLEGDFSWNGGAPNILLDLSPFVKIGGQMEVTTGGRAGIECRIQLLDVPLSEWGVPILGQIKLSVPVFIAAGFEVTASGKVILSTPKFLVSDQTNFDSPGKVGVSYTPSGGFKSDFGMKTSTAKNRLGIVQGTNAASSDSSNLTAQGQVTVGMGMSAGAEMTLRLAAQVKLWLAKLEINAEAGNVFLGFKVKGQYVIDYDKNTSRKTRSDGDAGIGVFFQVSPSINVDTPFFRVSYNLFSLDPLPIWIYKFPFNNDDEKEEPLEPAETRFGMDFFECQLNPNTRDTCEPIHSSALPPITINKDTVIYSSETISFDSSAVRTTSTAGFKYFYAYRDKPTDQLLKFQLPVTIDSDGTATVNKTGITDIVYEYIISDPHGIDFISDNMRTTGVACRVWRGRNNNIPDIPANECGAN